MLFKHLCALVPVIGISLGLMAAPPTPVVTREISTAMATSRPNEWIIGFDNLPALTNLFSWAPSPLGLDFITVLPSIQGAVIKIPTFLESANIAGWIDTVRDLPGVRFIEPNDQVHLHRTIPNDALFSRQYGLANPGQPEGTAGKDIDAPLAWDVTTDARSTLIAILDTGVDATHPDLKNNLWINPGESGADETGADKRLNGIDDDHNGLVDDWHGWDFANGDNDPDDDFDHGTHVAGIIGAEGHNGIGGSGVVWTASMVAIKTFNSNGLADIATIVKALDYARSLGARVVNNSWGKDIDSESLRLAIEQTEQAGMVMVVSAGNDESFLDESPIYPAAYPFTNIITVGATDPWGRLASFSNHSAKLVHLGAPGVDIWSTVPGGQYAKMSGTSMAAPFVTGLAALLLELNPHMTPQQVRSHLQQTALPDYQLAGLMQRGGIVNGGNALDLHDQESPAAVPSWQQRDADLQEIRLTWEMAGDDGDEGTAAYYQLRVAPTPIHNEADWERATPVVYRPLPGAESSRALTADLVNIPWNFVGYAQIRAVDNAGNEGPLHPNSLPLQTLPANRSFTFDGQSLEGWVLQPPWGLELIDGYPVITDSPGAKYDNNRDICAQMPPLYLPDNHAVIELETAHQLEKSGDFGLIEISTDQGVSWQEVLRLTGWRSRHRERVNLRPWLPASSSYLLVRYRLTTDASASMDGWQIHNIIGRRIKPPFLIPLPHLPYPQPCISD